MLSLLECCVYIQTQSPKMFYQSLQIIKLDVFGVDIKFFTN